MARRTYTDDEKAAGLAALTAHGGDLRKAARAAGVSARTLGRWRDTAPAAVAAIATQKTADLADMMRGIAERAAGLTGLALGSIEGADDPGGLALEHLSDLNRITGTAIDKVRLLSGEPTTTGELTVRYVNDWRGVGRDG